MSTAKLPEVLIMAWGLQQNIHKHPEGHRKMIVTSILALATTAARLACHLAEDRCTDTIDTYCVVQAQISQGTKGVLNALSNVFDYFEGTSAELHSNRGNPTVDSARHSAQGPPLGPSIAAGFPSDHHIEGVAAMGPCLDPSLLNPLADTLVPPLLMALKAPLLESLVVPLRMSLAQDPALVASLVAALHGPLADELLSREPLVSLSGQQTSSSNQFVPQVSPVSSKALDPIATSSSGFRVKHGSRTGEDSAQTKKKRMLPPSWRD